MSLSERETADFDILLGEVGDVLDGQELPKTKGNLHRLLLVAFDLLDDGGPNEDLLGNLLMHYTTHTVNERTKGITRACRRVCRITNDGSHFTGILVAPDLVLTAAHDMKGVDRPEEKPFAHPSEIELKFDFFTFSDNTEHFVPCRPLATPSGEDLRIIASSPTLDYVVFRIEPLIGLDFLHLGRRLRRGWMDGNVVKVEPAGDVLVLQHALGDFMKASEGVVDANVAGLPAGQFNYQTQATFGASGAPVLNQKRQLVGMHMREENGVEKLLSFKAIYHDLRKKELRLPRFPLSKTFLQAWSRITLRRDEGLALLQ